MWRWNEILLNLACYGLVAAAAGLVAFVLYVRKPVCRWWPMQRLQLGEWTGRELILAFFLFFLTLDFARGLLDHSGFFTWIFEEAPNAKRRAIWAGPLALVLFLVLTFWMLRVTTQTGPRDFGLVGARWRANVLLGYLGYVVAAPLILGLYFGIVLLLDLLHVPITQHVFEELAKESLLPIEWGLIFFMAILIAPMQEELLYRGLLQGWLLRAAPVSHLVVAGVTFFLVTSPYAGWLGGDLPFPGWGMGIFFGLLLAVYVFGVRRAWTSFLDEAARTDLPPGTDVTSEEGLAKALEWDIERRRVLWQKKSAHLAIYASAMLFAVSHSSWPQPIPLFPLGLVLGYLAYRTQSLIPALVLHALFNLVASLVLILGSS